MLRKLRRLIRWLFSEFLPLTEPAVSEAWLADRRYDKAGDPWPLE